MAHSVCAAADYSRPASLKSHALWAPKAWHRVTSGASRARSAIDGCPLRDVLAGTVGRERDCQQALLIDRPGFPAFDAVVEGLLTALSLTQRQRTIGPLRRRDRLRLAACRSRYR